VLAIGFSTPDYIGHLYGPRSQEVADTVLRTDLLLAGLLEIIDFEVGSGRWALVLTSDHGIAPIPETLQDMEILPRRESGYRFDVAAARIAVESTLSRRFFNSDKPPADFPGSFSAWEGSLFPFVYVDPAAAQRLRISFDELLEQARLATASLGGVAQVYTRAEGERLACGDDPFARAALRSWNEERGGDLLIRLAPYWIPGSAPTTHGSPYEYDAHVPLVFYGEGVRPGRYQRRVSMTDLAPTLARLLGISAPPQSEGQVLSEALR
jgi:arylsulfatase A-like enzyme